MRIQVLLLAIAIPGIDQADGLASVEATKQVCAQAAEKFSREPELAYATLLPYWPLPKEEIQNLGYQTKTQLGMVGDRFGAAIGSEHVKTSVAGHSLVKHMFLIKHEKHSMRFSCVFYKPKDEWMVNAVVWDDKPQDLLSNEG